MSKPETLFQPLDMSRDWKVEITLMVIFLFFYNHNYFQPVETYINEKAIHNRQLAR